MSASSDSVIVDRAEGLQLPYSSDRYMDMRAECFLRKRPVDLPNGANMARQPVPGNHALRMIGHDMKSLVGAVISATEMISLELHEISARSDGHDLITDYTQIIQQAGGDMMLLLNAILHSEALSDMDDCLMLHSVHDIESELHKVITAFSSVAQLKGVTMTLKVAKNLPTVYWDMDKLRLHVINNIVTNALRHTPAGGEVIIEVESSIAGMVSILIADSGNGVPQEYREKIFEKHWQGDNPHNDGMCQRGLGLFNAMLITRAHHGSIRVMDNPKSNGALFRIDLPCAGAAAEPEHLHAPAPAPAMYMPFMPPVDPAMHPQPVWIQAVL